MLNVIVYTLAVITLYSSMSVINAKNSVNSVISLIMVFIMLSMQLILLNADSLGLIIIMVYVGAVSILFLFVIMLLGNEENKNESIDLKSVCWYLLCSNVILMYGFNDDVIGNSVSNVSSNVEWCNVYDEVSNIEVLGIGLYALNLYNVLLSGVMLLMAIVGGVVLGNK